MTAVLFIARPDGDAVQIHQSARANFEGREEGQRAGPCHPQQVRLRRVRMRGRFQAVEICKICGFKFRPSPPDFTLV